MKIMLTGAAGFIGFHLSKSLLDDGYEVFGIDNFNNYYDNRIKYDRAKILKSYTNFSISQIDINDKKMLSNAFKLFNPQKVVNLAAQPGVRGCQFSSQEYINSNMFGFLNIIELSRLFEVDGFFYASSSSVYSANNKVPSSESDNIKMPVNLYAATKRSNELIAHSYSYLYELNTTGLRYFTVYGSWYRPDMAIFIFIDKIISGEAIPVHNYGKMKRDFTFIDDIVNGTRSAIDSNYKCEIFNLGNNKSIELMSLISIIEENLGRNIIIDYKPMQFGEVYETCADISHSKEKIGYEPQTTIKIGLPKLIKWYKEYYNV
tara:strand:+ start:2364 stop:3317 length:954 start_codon:yes stop_codon:yes gene_type:complete